MKVLIALLSLLAIVSSFKFRYNEEDPKAEAASLGKAIQSTLSGNSGEKFVDYLAKDYHFTKCSHTLNKDQTIEYFRSNYPSGKVDFSLETDVVSRGSDGGLIITGLFNGAGIKSKVVVVAKPNKSLKGKYQIESMETVEKCKE